MSATKEDVALMKFSCGREVKVGDPAFQIIYPKIQSKRKFRDHHVQYSLESESIDRVIDPEIIEHRIIRIDKRNRRILVQSQKDGSERHVRPWVENPLSWCSSRELAVEKLQAEIEEIDGEIKTEYINKNQEYEDNIKLIFSRMEEDKAELLKISEETKERKAKVDSVIAKMRLAIEKEAEVVSTE